jgi:hypothetical protein
MTGMENRRLRNGRTATGLTALAGLAGLACPAALVLTILIAIIGIVPVGADAAPNPLRRKTTMHTVSIAADGSYSVRMDTMIDLAQETKWGFGDEIHDGFRLPESEALLPPYLRAEYSSPKGHIDKAPAEATLEKELHSVDIGFATGNLEPGTHWGVLDYRVTGAAVPAESGGAVPAEAAGAAPAETEDRDEGAGAVVYFRPLDRGDLIIESDAPITAVDCEALAPHGETCGKKSGEKWTVPAEDLEDERHEPIDAVRISIDTDLDDLVDPVIDE